MRTTAIPDAKLFERLSAWEGRRPVQPSSYYPQFTNAFKSGVHFTVLPFAWIGFIVGFAVLAANGPHPIHFWVELQAPIVPLEMAVAFAAGGPVLLGLLINAIGWLVYKRNLRIWENYANDLHVWRAAGRQEFQAHRNNYSIWSRVLG